MKVTNIVDVRRLLQTVIELSPEGFVVHETIAGPTVGMSIVVRSGPATVRLEVDVVKVACGDRIDINLETGEVTGELSREADYQWRT